MKLTLTKNGKLRKRRRTRRFYLTYKIIDDCWHYIWCYRVEIETLKKYKEKGYTKEIKGRYKSIRKLKEELKAFERQGFII
jgi:hypothetical protein